VQRLQALLAAALATVEPVPRRPAEDRADRWLLEDMEAMGYGGAGAGGRQ